MKINDVKREIIDYLYRHPDEKIAIVGWGVMSYREVADRAVRDKGFMEFLLKIFTEMARNEIAKMGLEAKDSIIYEYLVEMLRRS